MGRPARPVRAHGTADVALRWAGLPGRCAHGTADVGRVRLSARPRPWARHRPRHVIGHYSDPERQRNRTETL